MLKLTLRVLGLTVVLQAASLAFAEEMIVTLLILFTIALTTAARVMRRDETALTYEAERLATVVKRSEPVTASSTVETPL